MFGALTGFAVIGSIIALGYCIARFGLFPVALGPQLGRFAYFVATPALLFDLMAHASLGVIVSPFAATSALAAVVTAGLFSAVVARRRLPFAENVLASASSAYVNGNNIGLPVAVLVVGSRAYVAPILLVQFLVFAPAVLAMLEIAVQGRARPLQLLLGPIRNPIIVASVLGVLAGLLPTPLPSAIFTPFSLVGGASVPLLLVAFGMSLRGRAPLADRQERGLVLTATAFKVVLMPAIAFALAEWVFHLDARSTRAAVIMATLPTAQNMANYANQFRRGETLVRDIVLATTVGAAPAVLLVSLLVR